ncbi:unnamed protein product [Moneuplotes crassus]|uniref:Uncharacterized protein n=1 Tax=Euplotes crassus TaxID=5936 RepID=A0AAD1U9R6_EUPCR|nr:unnamed protein product [Moneuplotes crassus]
MSVKNRKHNGNFKNASAFDNTLAFNNPFMMTIKKDKTLSLRKSMGKLPPEVYKFGRVMNNNYKTGVSKDFPLRTPYTESHQLSKQIFDLEKPEYMQRMAKRQATNYTSKLEKSRRSMSNIPRAHTSQASRASLKSSINFNRKESFDTIKLKKSNNLKIFNMQLKQGMPKELQEKISFMTRVGSVKMNKVFKTLSPDQRRELRKEAKYLPFSQYYGDGEFMTEMMKKNGTKSVISDYCDTFNKKVKSLKGSNCSSNADIEIEKNKTSTPHSIPRMTATMDQRKFASIEIDSLKEDMNNSLKLKSNAVKTAVNNKKMEDITRQLEDTFKTTRMSLTTADTKYSSVFAQLKKENHRKSLPRTILHKPCNPKPKSKRPSSTTFSCGLTMKSQGSKRAKTRYSNRKMLDNIEKGVFDYYWNMKSVRQGNAAKMQMWMQEQRKKVKVKSTRL